MTCITNDGDAKRIDLLVSLCLICAWSTWQSWKVTSWNYHGPKNELFGKYGLLEYWLFSNIWMIGKVSRSDITIFDRPIDYRYNNYTLSQYFLIVIRTFQCIWKRKKKLTWNFFSSITLSLPHLFLHWNFSRTTSQRVNISIT